MDKMYYAIGEVAKQSGLSTTTLNRWHNNGMLVAHHMSSVGKKKFYSQEQLDKLLNRQQIEQKRIVIGYARVSSHSQKEDLNRQIELLESYLIAQGESFTIISDLGSGMNFNKKGLIKLIQMIEHNEVSKIVITYKDRLVRFGFDLLKQICDIHQTEIEVINHTEKSSDEVELSNDLIEIITAFSARLYGKHSHKKTKLLDVMKDESL